MMRHLPFLFVLLILASCSERQNDMPEITLPASPLLSNESYWGVIDKSFVPIYQERDNRETLLTTLRQGDIVEVLVRYRETDLSPVWLQVRWETYEGWISGNGVLLYSSRDTAETMVIQMQKED